jgi:zinc protease
MPNAECRMPNAECRMPDAGCRMPDAGCRMPDAGCRMPDAEFTLHMSEMRHALTLIFALLIAVPARAQDTLTTAYEVNGVQVVHRRNTANDVVAVQLYLLGGTRQVTPRTAGIETLILAASEYGTRKYPRDALRRATAKTGSAITIDPDVDWTVFGFQGIRQELDSTWAVWSERLMHPTLDEGAVSLVRNQLLTGARQRRITPDQLVRVLADSAAFTGHPYALEPVGTVQSLQALTVADLKKYHADQFVTSRMLLVVAGNITREQVEKLVGPTIATLPRGDYKWQMPPTIPERQTSLTSVNRPLPTNYLIGYFAGPAASSADYPAFRVAMALLSSSLHRVIREERSLSYAAYAPVLDRAITSGAVYATTVSPGEVLPLMRAQIERLQREWLQAAGLREYVEQFITDYWNDNETNAGQAESLARAQLYRNDYRLAGRFMDEIRKVSPDDVRRVAREYMRNIQFAYVGDPARIPMIEVRRF